MRRICLATLATVAVFSIGMGSAQATLFYDASLQNSDYLNGTGNKTSNGNTHWSTDVGSDGVELGLGVVERYLGWYAPDAGTSTYHVPTGATVVPGKSGTIWGFEFSINTGSLNTLDTTVSSICMKDVGKGTFACFDPLNIAIINDNTVTGANLAQNSEALSFLNINTAFGDTGYDIDADDTYIFSLTLNDANGGKIAAVDATVIAGNGAPAPEPATLALFGSSLFGMGWLKRKRRNANA